MVKKLTSAILLLLILLLGGVPALADDGPVVEWERTFGDGGDDMFYSVQQTTDGGYILAGYTDSFGNGYQAYLVKTDAQGILQWEKAFGGSGDDCAYSVQQTTNGGYILAGYTNTGGKRKAYMVKTDTQGNLQWEKTLGRESSYAYSVQQTSDGGYILAGFSSADGIILVKTDAQGNLQWERDYFVGASPSVQQTSDGGYILVATEWYYYYGTKSRALLQKMDAQGRVQWSRTFSGRGACSVQQTTDGGYILAGHTFSDSRYNIRSVACLIKTDAQGNLQWEKTFGGIGNNYAYSVQQTSDGGYILAGGTYSSGNGGQACLIKTDAQGNLQWEKTFGGSSYKCFYSVQQTPDEGYVLVGGKYPSEGSSQAYLVKLGSDSLLPVESISAYPDIINLAVGETQQLTVTATLSDSTTKDVTGSAAYSIDNASVATVNNSGLVTAVFPGTATITVTYQNKTATVPVTVTSPVVVESISVAPAALSMVAGQAQQLTVTAHKSDGSTENVTGSATYQSSNESVTTVTDTGEVTAVSPGTATINVTYQDKTATVSVEVVELSSVLPQGDIIVLKVPQHLQPVTYDCAAGFTVTENGVNVPVVKVEVKDGTDGWPYSEVWLYLERPVTMGSDVVVEYNADPEHPIVPAGGGSGGSGDPGGGSGGGTEVVIPTSTVVVNHSTAPFTIERSTVYVPSSGDVVYVNLPTRVNAVDYQGGAGFTIHTGSVTVPVTRVVTEGTQLRIYPEYRIPSGEPVSITYTPVEGYEITTVGGAPLVVTTNPVVVTNESSAPLAFYDPVVSSDGTTVTMTVPADLGSVTYEGNAGFRVYVNGQEIPVVKVELDGNKIILYLGAPLVAGQPVEVSYSPVGGQPIATPGNALPEQSAAGDNRSEVTLVGLEVEPAAVNVEEGASQQLKVTARYSSGVAVDVTGLAAYESDNTSVARVSGDGLVTGVGAGTANITVTYGGQTAVVPVTVVNRAPVLESVSVVPARVDLAAGETRQLAVTAHYSDGSTRDVTSQAGYSSGDVSVATVNSSGLVTGKAQGSTTITVSYQGKTATVPVTVAAPAVESISAVPNPVTLAAGRSQQLTVTAVLSDGTKRDVTDQSGYSVDNTGIAVVSAGGLVTGKAQGSATITVSYQGKTTTVPVTVTAPVVEALTVEPGIVTLAAGGSRQLAVTARLSDGSTRDVTDESSYQVGNSTVAAVSGSGLVTGLAPGNTSITVSYAGQTVTVPVTVNAPPADLTGVSVQPNPLVLYRGSSQRLKVTENYSDNSSIDVTSFAGFQSSDPSVAKVDSFGLVTGVKEGTATILVTYKGEVYPVPVTVNPVVVTGPTRAGTTNPLVISGPTRPGGTGNSPTVSVPSRLGVGTAAPEVTGPASRGSTVSPGVNPPASRGSTGPGVVVPSGRPQSGDVTVIGRTR
jgi:uncharacterized protein YjdB